MKPDTHRDCVSCQLSPEMYRVIGERAQRLGLSRAAFVRQIVAEFLDAAHEPSPGRSWELDAGSEREPSR